MKKRKKGIVRHINEDDFNRLLTQTDDEKVSKRIIFIKWLYNLMLAAGIVAVLPVAILIIAAQEKIVSGLTTGVVKK